jgi:hypothetical protein
MAVVISLGFVFAYFALMVGALWGTWELIGMSPDTPNYLLPSAATLFDGHWHHVQRPFGYPALIYVAIMIGGSLNALVAFQLALYLLAGLLVYATVQIPLYLGSEANDQSAGAIAVYLFATGAMIGYILLSSQLLAFAFYVLPEFVSSATALVALTLCLILMRNHIRRQTHVAALAIAASVCAAMLISFKPSMTGTAGLTLMLAAWCLIRQSRYVSRWLLVGVLVAMLAIPSAVFIIDNQLVRNYRDSESIEFGALTAFCNNAPLIVRDLETPDTTSGHLLGDDGSRKVAQFLHDSIAAGTGQDFQIQGFNGDHCLWYFEEQRKKLEKEYFGTNPDEVVQTYRRLVIASILDAPGSYALRISEQMKAYLVSDLVTCDPGRQWDKPYAGYPLVDRLISQYAKGPTAQTLPIAPGASTLCHRLAPLFNLLDLPVIGVALSLSVLQLLRTWSRQGLNSAYARAVLLSTGFWLSGAVVVALVETFDRQRYVTVMFPVHIVALAIAGAYLVAGIIPAFQRPDPVPSAKTRAATS